eukprot:CAMPEP_0170193664 /NCGR_PEP_ID=MMETSP0040_2-20121228/57381_1 /TAXON_ID=641309 /ORGANISM="Lotharella oceanica, Strain CCMP622" /LENGTH=93 /DNA_ID=CAMNT_0010442361 /DNA_START=382 /DNA_END=659 /DNA_ORIENTATION=-
MTTMPFQENPNHGYTMMLLTMYPAPQMKNWVVLAQNNPQGFLFSQCLERNPTPVCLHFRGLQRPHHHRKFEKQPPRIQPRAWPIMGATDRSRG